MTKSYESHQAFSNFDGTLNQSKKVLERSRRFIHTFFHHKSCHFVYSKRFIPIKYQKVQMGYRVKLKGLKSGGSCCGRGIDATIPRTYPTILDESNSFRQAAWTSFCDEIDEALTPVKGIKNRTVRMVYFLFIMMFTSVITTAILITQTEIQGYLGRLWYFYVFGFIYLFPALVFCKMTKMQVGSMDKVYEGIRKVCMNTSNQFGDVSFRLISIRHTNGSRVWYARYILVAVAGVEDDNRTEPTGTDWSHEYHDDDFSPTPIGNLLSIQNRV